MYACEFLLALTKNPLDIYVAFWIENSIKYRGDPLFGCSSAGTML